MIFFTADTHFCHKGIIDSCKRPFANVEEMDEALIENWNKKVEILDDVYHLGDVIWGSKRQQIEEIIYRLNGRIHIIKGNHDHRKSIKIYESCSNIKWIKDYFELKVENELFILFHYAMRTWNKSHYNSYQLYGHSHGNLENSRLNNSMDVGVDVNDFKPVSLEEILEKLSEEKKRI